MSDVDRSGELYRPLTEEERLTIRAELREQKRESDKRTLTEGKEGQKLFAQHHHAVRLAALNTAADHGKAFVRYAVLLNGGALIALIALIGTIHSKADSALPRAVLALTAKLQLGLHFFVAGLMCAAIIAGIAFFQWFAYAQTFFHEGHTANAVSANNLFGGEDQTKALAAFERMDRVSEWLVYVSIAFGAASITCFGAGALKVAKAFSFYSLVR